MKAPHKKSGFFMLQESIKNREKKSNFRFAQTLPFGPPGQRFGLGLAQTLVTDGPLIRPSEVVEVVLFVLGIKVKGLLPPLTKPLLLLFL